MPNSFVNSQFSPHVSVAVVVVILACLIDRGVHGNGELTVLAEPNPFGNQYFNCDEDSKDGFDSIDSTVETYEIYPNSSLWVSGNASLEGDVTENGNPIREFTLAECTAMLAMFETITEVHMPGYHNVTTYPNGSSTCVSFSVNFSLAECVVLGPKKRTAIRTKASATAVYPDTYYDESYRGEPLRAKDRYEFVPFGPTFDTDPYSSTSYSFTYVPDNVVHFYCGWDGSYTDNMFRIDAFNTALDCALNDGYNEHPACCEETWAAPTTTTPTPDTSEPGTPGVETTPSTSTCSPKCGETDLGGGTCNAQRPDICTSCNSNKILVKGGSVQEGTRYGFCVKELACKNKKILFGADVKDKHCRCNDNCFYCAQTATDETCKKCENGFYLHEGVCVEHCPLRLTSSGIRPSGRKCLEPFTCKNTRAVGTGLSCQCADKDNNKATCHTCEFEAGEHGQKCTRCHSDTFLNKATNECQENCDGIPNAVSYHVGPYGAECRKPFTCAAKKDPAGDKCKCPKDIGGSHCKICDWRLDGTRCTRCTNGKFLLGNECVDTCEEGVVINAGRYEGKECQVP